jgi:hypothetical protein
MQKEAQDMPLKEIKKWTYSFIIFFLVVEGLLHILSSAIHSLDILLETGNVQFNLSILVFAILSLLKIYLAWRIIKKDQWTFFASIITSLATIANLYYAEAGNILSIQKSALNNLEPLLIFSANIAITLLSIIAIHTGVFDDLDKQS